MAGYDDTKKKIINALLGRPSEEEIQPDKHQGFALNLLEYIRGVEITANGPLVGVAYENTVPIQPDSSRAAYIAGVAQEKTAVFENFIQEDGRPVTIKTGEMEGNLVILIWNTRYWSYESIPTNIISQSNQANFYYSLLIVKSYQTEALALADKNPVSLETGKRLKVGQLVSIVDDGEKNGIYRIGSIGGDGTMSLELQGKLGDLSDYAKKGGSTKTLKEVDDEKAEHGYASIEVAKTLKQVEDNTSMKIKNEAVNGNFENGLIAPFSRHDGLGGESTLAINSLTPISGNYDIRLTITTPATSEARPFLNWGQRAANIGDKIYLHFYAKILSGIPTISGIHNGEAANVKNYGGDVINGRNTRIIDVKGTDVYLGVIYFNSKSVWDMQMDNFMRINLTETFGAGNEPTEEEMNLLISTLGTDYIEGEIPAQKIMQWQLKLAQNADDARLAIQDDLALKADQADLAQLAGDVNALALTDEPQVLTDFTSSQDARSSVPSHMRKPQLTISYRLNGVAKSETYIGPNVGPWGNDILWVDQYSLALDRYRESGMLLLKEGTKSLLNFNSRDEARQSVPSYNRWLGKSIGYRLNVISVFETFTGSSTRDWNYDIYWRDYRNKRIYTGSIADDTGANVENYIKKVECDQKLNLSMVFATTASSLRLHFRSVTNDGTMISFVGKLLIEDKNTLTNSESVRVLVEKYKPSDPNIYVTLDAARLISTAVPTVYISTIDSSANTLNALIDYEYIESYYGVNKLNLNKGKSYPYTNIPSSWGSHRGAAAAQRHLRAVLDIEVIGADSNEEFVYQIGIITKNRTANDWGNGIRLQKALKTDPTIIIETVEYRSPSAPPYIQQELVKIGLAYPTWMSIPAFGKTFRILIDGSQFIDVEHGEIANNSGSPLWGNYIDPATYKSVTGGKGVEEFSTVTRAAQDGKTGLINVGQSLIVGQKDVSVGNLGTFLAKPIEGAYVNIAPNKKFPPILNTKLKRISIEGVTMYVCSFSSTKVYYSTCRGGGYTSREDNRHPFMGMADKSAPDQVVKINIPEELEGGVTGEMGRRHLLYEMSDGNHLLEVENGVGNDANTRGRNLYRVTGLLEIDIENNEITIPVENITLLFALQMKQTRVLPAWNIHQYGKTVVVGPYGSGRTGLVYISKDCFLTWKCIFNAGIDTVYVEPKGSTGYWPTPESVIPAGSIDWALTGNGNVHIHGVAYDKWYDRIWVVTGDGTENPKSVTGIWYTDDEGLVWHKVALRTPLLPFCQYGTQMINIIPLQNCVLFGTDGTGDGFWRWNRNGKHGDVEVELVYQYTGANTGLAVLAGGYCTTKEGITLCTFNPDNESQGDYENYKGGIVATYNGYSFDKIYEDEFSEGTASTSEIDWRSMVTDCKDNRLLVKADNGGYIEITYSTAE